MRAFLIPLAAVLFVASPSVALAKVSITVDKDNQEMTVAVDGVERYRWPVSTGNPSHETPNGKFQTFRMEEDHFSKEFDDAPMPHSIFFTKVGHAIHGTLSERSLGSPVSHGCVRLSRANATTLYDLVKSDGLLSTTVTLTGSSRVALARRGKPATAVARRNPIPSDVGPTYDAAGNPVNITPQQTFPAQRMPQQAARDDDGYIYPADGSSSDRRYPSPRSYRRVYEAQGNYGYQSQYGGQGYGQQGYGQQGYYAPQPSYQPRGLFSDQD